MNGLTYQQLRDAEYIGLVALGPLLERKANGEDVAIELAILNDDLDVIGAALKEHPENPLTAIREMIEGRRLG